MASLGIGPDLKRATAHCNAARCGNGRARVRHLQGITNDENITRAAGLDPYAGIARDIAACVCENAQTRRLPEDTCYQIPINGRRTACGMRAQDKWGKI